MRPEHTGATGLPPLAGAEGIPVHTNQGAWLFIWVSSPY